MTAVDRLRSLLFAPADSARKLERAFASGADVVIADREDAVAPSAKQHAREVLSAVARLKPAGRWAVRINGLGCEYYLDDLVHVAALAPDYIMLPKCESKAQLDLLAAQIDVLERAAGLAFGQIGLLPLVCETAVGLENLDYSQATPRLKGLVFGAEDLSSDLGVSPRRADGEMTPLIAEARRRVAIAAAAVGVPAIDTPLPDHRNAPGMSAEAAAAAELGYAGKLCIHPAQIPLAHAAFAPSEAQTLWAAEVIAALSALGGTGVAVVQGRMVDKAHLGLAHKIQSLQG